MNRRQALLTMAAPFVLLTCAEAQAATIHVVKSPTCGCCGQWVEHLRANGFAVQVTDTEDLYVNGRQLGVPDELRSCHTATIEGYVIEGHVPAEDIRRLLQERPQALGLAVPGMPIGYPGMEQGDRRQPFATLLFDRNGRYRVFARHDGSEAAN
jgi:hypothetical protein